MKKFKFLKNKSALTIIELLVVICALGILAATAISSFKGYVVRSRMAEAFLLLGKMADLQVVYYENNQAFLETGPTNIPPPTNATPASFTGNWVSLTFGTSDPIRFGYRCYEDTGPTAWLCEAQGDQDNDGDPSIVQITIRVVNGKAEKGGAFYVFDELE